MTQAANVHVVFVAFETLRKPRDVDALIPAWSLDLKTWQKKVADVTKEQKGRRSLIIIDTIDPLSATEASNLPALLSSFIGPNTSLLAVYHLDVLHRPQGYDHNAYAPASLTLLKYLATTIFTVHALHHVLACKAARDRSHAEPSFGLEEGTEGVLQGLGANGKQEIVLEMEHRRKSGRGVRQWFCLPLHPAPKPGVSSGTASTTHATKIVRSDILLLEDHPQYRTPEQAAEAQAGDEGGTFELGLTAKQRRDREGVVLPYFDAQKGGGEGGRILYDMGSEDDFDEDEDEI
ncbi:hypothetical protein LTR86_000387 [Recurvomyces mirabilis]|nr:hypothetical protein LTR86_000387 [Recurvomyces mirabilis]